jgi:hypothetical protein
MAPSHERAQPRPAPCRWRGRVHERRSRRHELLAARLAPAQPLGLAALSLRLGGEFGPGELPPSASRGARAQRPACRAASLLRRRRFIRRLAVGGSVDNFARVGDGACRRERVSSPELARARPSSRIRRARPRDVRRPTPTAIWRPCSRQQLRNSASLGLVHDGIWQFTSSGSTARVPPFGDPAIAVRRVRSCAPSPHRAARAQRGNVSSSMCVRKRCEARAELTGGQRRAQRPQRTVASGHVGCQRLCTWGPPIARRIVRYAYRDGCKHVSIPSRRNCDEGTPLLWRRRVRTRPEVPPGQLGDVPSMVARRAPTRKDAILVFINRGAVGLESRFCDQATRKILK